MEFILCGDLNINYIGTDNKKTQLDNLLNMYNLIDTVHFPTRITDTSFSTTGNIFVNKRSNYSINPYMNGLSDHDAQVLTLNDLCQPTRPTKTTYVRNMNKQNITDFQFLLSWELWQDVFEVDDVNSKFNNFLNTYLRCYHSSFSKIMISKSHQSHNEWITKGIKVSCKKKRAFYLM